MADYRTAVKAWFKTLLKPTQTQFYNWLDNTWFKDEKIPVTQIEGVDSLLELKADKEYVDALLPKIIIIGGFAFDFKSIKGTSLPTEPIIGDLALNGLLSENELATVLRFLGGDFSKIEAWEVVGTIVNILNEEIN